MPYRRGVRSARLFIPRKPDDIKRGVYTHGGCEFFASPSYERSGSRRGVFSVVMPPHFV